LFGNNKFLKEYPYFLPCAVPATFTVVAWFVTLFFLKEVRHTLHLSAGLIMKYSLQIRLTPLRNRLGSSSVEIRSELDRRKTLFCPLELLSL
jgi:hypothetical protein